jgi:hypothetical protein
MQPTSDLLIDRKRLKSKLASWRALALLAVFGGAAIAFSGIGSGTKPGIGGDYIAQIHISDVMVDDPKRDAMMKDILEDDHAKALIVQMDSPGGTTVGGETIYLQLKEIGKKKPVVGVMRTLCASACYMASLGTDHVVAREGTLTGSIGVLLQSVEVSRLADKLGITSITVKSGAMSVQVHFAAKPFADQPSSGLHVHTHLADEQGQNVFHKTEEWTSDYLRHSLGGLLANMRGDMPIFFPNEADYKRLDDVDHVPKIFGWGVNNRYCALRIPMDPDLYNKHIEHRVPCANADAYAVIAAILLGILRGLREGIEPPEQAHGKFLEGAEFKQALLPAPIG